MQKLTSPAVVQALMDRHGAIFTKSLGQNFLVDENILQKILAVSGIEEQSFVLEIGPGIGVLTQGMAACGARPLAVEIDRHLIPILAETLADFPDAHVVNQDILKTDLPALWTEYFEEQPFFVVANLPYYITSAVIMELLQSGLPLRRMTFMVQKEVAERMSAGPGSKDYGLLSVATQFYCTPQLQFTVPPTAFLPRPKVGSAVITLDPLPASERVDVNEQAFFKVVRAAFAMRRKTLHNNLCQAGFAASRDEVAQKIAACGLSPSVRAESLSIGQFASLTNAFFPENEA